MNVSQKKRISKSNLYTIGADRMLELDR